MRFALLFNCTIERVLFTIFLNMYVTPLHSNLDLLPP